ncbi:MAG: AAA family ATPase [Candidatus Doudnabacteria bacterium]|nr:AAA family ATPase [Candidatus Doudnabacteria bacterium]
MYLKRLEIHGFKSFAQKTTMEFGKGVIAIVGPNGSGKSNVADSLRWVLGEQSAKIIRGKKSDDVIYAGSDKKARMGFAEVFATFDNSDRRIPIDAPEVSIGRRIDRSGESEYLINGQKVRLLDIIDLVLKSNIGTSRYTVIGQGTIDQMILAGPSETKNLLDEASGVKSYYLKREKTLRRLEQTAQNLMRAEDLIAEIEPRLKSLRRQAKKMEARAEFEQELKIYQREFFGRTYVSLKSGIDSFVSQIQVLQSKRHAMEEGVSEHRKILDTAALSGQSKSAEKQRHLQNALQVLQGRKNSLLEDLSLVRGKMQSHKTAGSGDAKTLQVELHQVGTRLSELKSKAEQAESDRQRYLGQIEAQKKLLEHISSNLSVLYQKIQQPESVDWESFNRELLSLEAGFEEFYAVLAKQDWSLVFTQSKTFKESFVRFNRLAKESMAMPQLQIQKIQNELQTALKQKEQLNSDLSALELQLTKSKLENDFLFKELKENESKKLHLELELKKAQSNSVEDFLKELVTEELRIQKEAESLAKELLTAENALKEFLNAQMAENKALHERESHLRHELDELSKIKDRESALNIEKAKLDIQMEVLQEEIRRILGTEDLAAISISETNLGPKDVPTLSVSELENRIARLKNQLEMIGGMDELTMKEYQETELRYTNLAAQVADLKKGMDDLRSVMDELDQHIKTKFSEAFHRINEKFEHYFRILFNGGRAYLSMVKADEPKNEEAGTEGEAEDKEPENNLRPEEKIVEKYEHGASNIVGIDIKATPPNKKLSSIQALSGGERSLTSIALLCSLLTCFPSPFVVLDEVDAALDDANTIRFAQIISSLAEAAQFVTITHNRETMAHANMLYGVTMGEDGISKLLSVKLEQAKVYAK